MARIMLWASAAHSAHVCTLGDGGRATVRRAMRPGIGIDPLGSRGPGFVDRFGLIGGHARAPRGHGGRITGTGGPRAAAVGTPSSAAHKWSRPRGRGRDSAFVTNPLDQRASGGLPRRCGSLQHRAELRLIIAAIGTATPTTPGCRHRWRNGCCRRADSRLGHLHVPRVGIGGRDARLARLLAGLRCLVAGRPATARAPLRRGPADPPPPAVVRRLCGSTAQSPVSRCGPPVCAPPGRSPASGPRDETIGGRTARTRVPSCATRAMVTMPRWSKAAIDWVSRSSRAAWWATRKSLSVW